MKRAWPKNNFSPQSWVRNFFLVKLETLCYQLVKKSDPPNGVLGQALFWRKCLVLSGQGNRHDSSLVTGRRDLSGSPSLLLILIVGSGACQVTSCAGIGLVSRISGQFLQENINCRSTIYHPLASNENHPQTICSDLIYVWLPSNNVYLYSPRPHLTIHSPSTTKASSSTPPMSSVASSDHPLPFHN